MNKTVCVFCASSSAIHSTYGQAARELGTLLAQAGYNLVFGGGSMGLMAAIAESAQAAGAHITGVIPTALNRDGIAHPICDELIVTRDMRERKAEMDTRSDAFVALPGGFGTLEEIVEHLTLRQLNMHPKPVVLLNTLGFYDPLLRFFDHLIEERFAKPEHLNVYHVAESPEAVLAYLEAYQPQPAERKYF